MSGVEKKIEINFLTRDLFDIFYEEAKRISSDDTEAKKITGEALRAFFKCYSKNDGAEEGMRREAS